MLYLKKRIEEFIIKIQKFKKDQKGQVALVSIVILIVVGVVVATSISIMVAAEFKMTDNAVKSDMVFYATEGALSDVLVRVKKNPSWPSTPYHDSISLNGVNVERDITGDVVKTIDVAGNLKNITKHLRATYNTETGEYKIFEVEP